MNDKWTRVTVVLLAFALALAIWYLTPGGRAIINLYTYQVQKVDDATDYKTRKEIEDTCRAMISSYTSDKLIFEQYANSDNEEKQSWAEQARMRANKTAASYNEYVLKNSFVWKGNIPGDIKSELPYI